MQNKEQTSPLPQVACTFKHALLQKHKRISPMSPWVCVGFTYERLTLSPSGPRGGLNLNPVSEQIPALGISSRTHGTKNPLSKGELRT
ncbi:hypothetical protein PISMIDRAFT_685764 [Pisolithus microcarpus 441]|uniref:Uncharacterized protein n=1 Tax=Pisolithus microcarpus 441 TaxID=765257 RepID=A0A0C9ZAX1_9AGAM|nr:hypothetical protein PISMIDRAFT_685764 [Pisolithus microcarpus 441]